MKKQFYIGCSGFAYHQWQDEFYPEGILSSERLSFYSGKFKTVEINSTFYHYPKAATLQKLYDTTPEDFRFTLKVGKKITHILRLKNTQQDIIKFQEHAKSILKEKLIHFLFQLPPSYSYSEENLQRVLEAIPHNEENVVEFRHVSWWNDETFKRLKEAGITFCNVDYPKLPKEFHLTTPRFYMRLHGYPVLFKSDYSGAFLENMAKQLPYCEHYTFYFNNTMTNSAWNNALDLIEILNSGSNE